VRSTVGHTDVWSRVTVLGCCQETEEFLSGLVVNKTVEAKIDRLEGIVCFSKAKNPADLLDDWTSSISSLMNYVNKTTHLITKEEMIHKLL